MKSIRYSFRKGERLTSKKIIRDLFREGTNFYTQPFKVIFQCRELPTPYPAQIMVTVSRKGFRRAVNRNAVRRIVKEAYRLNKGRLYDVLLANELQCAVVFIYTGRTIPDLKVTEEKIINIIDRLIKEIDSRSPLYLKTDKK